MRFIRRHPADGALLLAADHALPRYRQAIVNYHLRRCAVCRGRLGELDRMFTEAVEACRDLTPAPASASTEAVRARLHEQMSTLSATWGRSRSVRLRRYLNGLPTATSAGAAVVLVIALAHGAFILRHQRLASASTSFAGVLPIQALTPGAVADLDAQALCTAKVTSRRPIAPAVREAVLRDYRMTNVAEHEYELDYLITPELGGIPDAKNLWPERYESGIWNARVKDDLERLLPQVVCDGRLDLRTAQRDIADNWIAAYQKYFHTQSPIPTRTGLRDDDDDAKPHVASAPVLVEALQTRLPPTLLQFAASMRSAR